MLHLLTTLANGFPVCSFWASKGSWKGRKKTLTGVTCLLYMWECVYVVSDISHEHCSYIIVRRGLHSSSTLCCCWLCVGEREGGKWLARSVHAKAAVPHTDRQADTHTHTASQSHNVRSWAASSLHMTTWGGRLGLNNTTCNYIKYSHSGLSHEMNFNREICTGGAKSVWMSLHSTILLTKLSLEQWVCGIEINIM